MVCFCWRFSSPMLLHPCMLGVTHGSKVNDTMQPNIYLRYILIQQKSEWCNAMSCLLTNLTVSESPFSVKCLEMTFVVNTTNVVLLNWRKKN